MHEWDRKLRLTKACSSSCRGLFGCPFSFIFVVVNYGSCWSCCSYNTIVEKEEEIVITQKHKNQQAKETQETQSHEGEKLGKICGFQH